MEAALASIVAAATGPVVRLKTAGGRRSHMATSQAESIGSPSSGRSHAATHAWSPPPKRTASRRPAPP